MRWGRAGKDTGVGGAERDWGGEDRMEEDLYACHLFVLVSHLHLCCGFEINMSLSSFVFHLSEYHADIHTHFYSILNRCDYDGNRIFVVLTIWDPDERQDV